MGDKEARALGAGVTANVGGKEYSIKPITLGLLQQLQREAMASYKKSVIATYAESMDALGDVGPVLLEKKLDEVSKMQIDDLPKRVAYTTNHLPVSGKLRKELVRVFGDDTILEQPEAQVLELLAVAMDQKSVSTEDVEKLTGKRAVVSRIPYDSWWVTASYEGMIALIYTSLSQEHEVSREEIGKWPMKDIAEVARAVESVTAPDMGNT